MDGSASKPLQRLWLFALQFGVQKVVFSLLFPHFSTGEQGVGESHYSLERLKAEVAFPRPGHPAPASSWLREPRRSYGGLICHHIPVQGLPVV